MPIHLSLWDGVMLAGAGLLSGALNAAAGGGSLITFPALLAAGYPPIIANVTNNVGAFPGYLGGGWGYRRVLKGQRGRLAPLIIVSAIGSLVGVALILISPQSVFENIVPFLVLAACGILALQPYLNKLFVGQREQGVGPGALAAQLLAAIYGGYFGAALGVAVLALLGISIKDTLQRLNALKAVVQIIIGGVAAIAFAALTSVAWKAAAIIAPASIVGGFLGAQLAQRVSDRVLRIAIVTYGMGAAIWLILR